MNDWSRQVELYLKLERNEQFRNQVNQLKRDGETAELKRLFGRERLTFGTAGIRGAMGPGFSQMNDLVIIQTTQGLVSYLLEMYGSKLCQKRGVVIGHDARHNSARFARLTALVFLQRAIPVYFCEQIVATPLIAFAVNQFDCSCGIMITASHNPKQDNGYKVYWSNGAQILSPHDIHIQMHIMHPTNQEPWNGELSFKHEYLTESSLTTAPSSSTLSVAMRSIFHRIYDDLCRSYFAYIQRLVGEHKFNNQAAHLAITYTSMHGVGHHFLSRALSIAGFERVHPVPSQMEPDPEFPSVKFPNPEEAGALDLAFETAVQTESTLILANDPDADRCAAALYWPKSKQRRVLTGNEIGQLLGWWAWHQHQQAAASRSKSSGGGGNSLTFDITAPTSKALNSHSPYSDSTSSFTSSSPISQVEQQPQPEQQTAAADATPRDSNESIDLDKTDAPNDDKEAELTNDKTPAMPITKPIIGTGLQVSLSSGSRPSGTSDAGKQPQLYSVMVPKPVQQQQPLYSCSKKTDDCYMLSTAVSSCFLHSMARCEGFHFVETLTGFKYMGNVAHNLLRRYKSVLFAYEEAIGYMVDTQILDKDGVSAAIQLAQCAAFLQVNYKRTLLDQLDWLYTKYGYHFSLNSYFLCHDPQLIRIIFHELQSDYPSNLGSTSDNFHITRIRDLNNGIDNGTHDHKPDLPVSANSFMMTFWVGNEIRFTVRTSGTEPKIKYYSEIVASLPKEADKQAEAKERAQERLQRFVELAVERCLRPQFYKLQPAS